MQSVLTVVLGKLLLTFSFLCAGWTFGATWDVVLSTGAMDHVGCHQLVELWGSGLVWEFSAGEAVNVLWPLWSISGV